MTVNFTKSKFNLREKLKELERPSVDKLVTRDGNDVYIDTITGNTKLENIDSVISDTAVDIFIYDTSKDSDGGAWRKRTTHTSWYNETLGTATRGTRREFPAVAVIVISTDQVFGDTLTIYDGDDPDLPMWMVFRGRNTNAWIAGWRASISTASVYIYLTAGTAVSALNGKICVSHNDAATGATYSSGHGIQILDFLTEKSQVLGSNTYSTATSLSPFVNRNTHSSNYYKTVDDLTSQVIASVSVNDVAMTVLPNAPIDETTGLPVPTIAVATDGGVSVIKDDGTVYDITYTSFEYTKKTHFTVDNKIAVHTDTNSQTGSRFYRIYEIPSADLNAGTYNTHTDALRSYGGDFVLYGYDLRYYWNGAGNWYAPHTIYTKDGPVFGEDNRSRNGIAIISENINSPSTGLVCGISTDCNTGWMHGDIKGAFLSDTDTTNITGSNLIDGTAAEWSVLQGTGSHSNPSAGVLRIVDTDGNYVVKQDITTVVGKQYVFSCNTTAARTAFVQIRDSNNTVLGDNNTGYSGSFIGGITITFTATTTTTTVRINDGSSSAFTVDVETLQVRLAELDRSVNNNGLQVFGTVTKSAVATGADLVAYSGFSNSNYLLQPYNSDLDVGTGDISVIGWFKSSNSNGGYLFERLDPARTGNRLRGFVTSTQLQFLISASAGLAIPTSSSYTDGNWHFYSGVKRGSVMYLYADGVLLGSSDVGTNSVNNTSATLTFGIRSDATSYFQGGNMALWRVSASAPSAEQIKKMYEDEKVLFQENAACTLYGSSDAITALAYAEVTEQLHVGTSSGRSDFQGLRRINNTTTAVTTAISAHDEFIVEQ